MGPSYPYGPIGAVRDPWKIWIVLVILSFIPSIMYFVYLDSLMNDLNRNDVSGDSPADPFSENFIIFMSVYLGISVVVFIIQMKIGSLRQMNSRD